MNKYPKVSIIVLNWNRPGDTIECLRSIFQSNYPNYEVIVVDNGSTDSSVQIIRKSFPQVIVIENEKNIGFTGGNNQAMHYALKRDAEYLWLLNNDTITEPDTLNILVETADNHEEVGLISPMILWYGQSEKVQFCGYYLDVENYSFQKMPLHSIPDDEVHKKDIILWGTALLIKRRVVEDIGFLDEKYFAYAEDSEYCMRAKRFGYQSMVQPSARIYHKDSQSTGSIKAPMQVFLRSRNPYFFWMDILNGRKRKFHYIRYFFANTISKFTGLREENLLKAADACLDGAWAAIRGIGGPWDNNVKMPRSVKRILSWHPYFWVGLLNGNIRGTLVSTKNRMREWKRDINGENDIHRP